MTRVRFAPSPTGSLHVGNALSAVANRDFGDWLLLRIDDTDAARNIPGGEDEIRGELEWLGVRWDEGPVRQSERQDVYREAADRLGSDRFGKITLLREDGSATYQLASVVDDIEFGITHVIRGNDHRPNEQLHRDLTRALGAEPPEYIHHGLILGEDGRKLSKREFGATVASLRDAGIPAQAVRRYLDELGLPKHDVHYDVPRIRRLAIEAIAAMSDEELAAAADAPVEVVPATSPRRTTTPVRCSSPSPSRSARKPARRSNGSRS
jgi:glutamyl/glutaminyl-tRNA synthetase